MKLPFYLGFFSSEPLPPMPDDTSRAVLGAHFQPDGTLLVPQQDGTLLVMDDSVLPEALQQEQILQASNGFSTLYFDFEQPVNASCGQLLQAFSAQYTGNLWVPPAYAPFAPTALVCLPIPVCNHFSRFCQAAQRQYPQGWVLEVHPCRMELPLPCRWPVSTHRLALLQMQAQDGICTVTDTKQTLLQKLTIAQRFGCQGAIGLWEELWTLWA